LPRLVGQSDSLRRARVANIRGKGKEVIRELCRREQGGRIWQHETCDKDIIEIIITDAIGTTGPVSHYLSCASAKVTPLLALLYGVIENTMLAPSELLWNSLSRAITRTRTSGIPLLAGSCQL
jgi:hypothetical protein